MTNRNLWVGSGIAGMVAVASYVLAIALPLGRDAVWHIHRAGRCQRVAHLKHHLQLRPL